MVRQERPGVPAGAARPASEAGLPPGCCRQSLQLSLVPRSFGVIRCQAPWAPAGQCHAASPVEPPPPDQEPLPVEVVGHGHMFPEEPECPGLLRVQVAVPLPEHPVAGDEQEGGEEIQHPPGAGNDCRTCGDEDPAEHPGAQDAEEQHAVLIFTGTAK